MRALLYVCRTQHLQAHELTQCHTEEGINHTSATLNLASKAAGFLSSTPLMAWARMLSCIVLLKQCRQLHAVVHTICAAKHWQYLQMYMSAQRTSQQGMSANQGKHMKLRFVPWSRIASQELNRAVKLRGEVIHHNRLGNATATTFCTEQ